MHGHNTPSVELLSSVALVQDLVNVHLNIETELLEQIFEEQCQHLASQLQSFVTKVVTVIHQSRVILGHKNATGHVGNIDSLGAEVHVMNLNVRNDNRC